MIAKAKWNWKVWSLRSITTCFKPRRKKKKTQKTCFIGVLLEYNLHLVVGATSYHPASVYYTFLKLKTSIPLFSSVFRCYTFSSLFSPDSRLSMVYFIQQLIIFGGRKWEKTKRKTKGEKLEHKDGFLFISLIFYDMKENKDYLQNPESSMPWSHPFQTGHKVLVFFSPEHVGSWMHWYKVTTLYSSLPKVTATLSSSCLEESLK